MIATDANVSRILIARRADSYLPSNIAAGEGGWGTRGWGAVGGDGVKGVQGEDCDPLKFP